MLSINFTLIIQVCNFLIAYRIFSSLFLKPAFDALVEDDRRFFLIQYDRKRMLQIVRDKQNDVEQQRAQQEKALHDMKPLVPHMSSSVIEFTVAHEPLEVSESQKQQLQATFKEMILRKTVHI